MEFARVGAQSLAALCTGAALAFAVPIAVALIWKFRKKERFTTILVGAATFLVFALILEKPIQNVLLFPTQMGLSDHAVSRFFSASPVLLALVLGLFPGVFEETGRLVAFSTVLKNRKNRETSVSHGIGHGGIEVMAILGVTYVTYIAYAVMINAGTFGTLIEQTAAQAPAQADALCALAGQIAGLTAAGIGMGLLERVFAVLFHIGASILVFYACRDKGRLWLYPLAIILHTAMDFIAALVIVNVASLSTGALEGIVAAFGILTFCGAYFLLYRKEGGRQLRNT
ncbi:MAG: YhfC family intramembrane metalloprotease [Oscillospiraceae bacterium]|nr:YhfC family intramembrane metalloprotease [Oscillospiraceae bacterium]